MHNFALTVHCRAEFPLDPAYFDSPLVGSSALAGCKSGAPVQKEPLAKAFSGRWVGAHCNLTCQNRSIRFDTTEIVQIRDGVVTPVFRILQTDLRGDVVELTLKSGYATAAMAFSGRKLREEAEAFRLHVTLITLRHRISMSHAQTDQGPGNTLRSPFRNKI